MGRRWREEDTTATMRIWRVPGLNVLRTRLWAPLTVQIVESSGGEGVWRSDKHPVSLLVGETADFSVQFDSGEAREFSGPGPRAFFCPARATMRVRSGPMRWIQTVQDSGPWFDLAAE
jgi:hypothetical protein